MIKYIIILMLFVFNTSAAQFTVYDITAGSGIVLTPGNSVFKGSCSFNWAGSKAIPVQEFFDGATSYSWSTVVIGTRDRCVNIKTDVSDVNYSLPFVNPSRFKNSVTGSRATFASSPNTGTFFTIEESRFEPNILYVTVGSRGTPDYFYCEVIKDSLEMQWLKMTGFETDVTKGWILSMSWFGSERRCADISMTFDPSLILPDAEQPVFVPQSCPVGCMPAP